MLAVTEAFFYATLVALLLVHWRWVRVEREVTARPKATAGIDVAVRAADEQQDQRRVVFWRRATLLAALAFVGAAMLLLLVD